MEITCHGSYHLISDTSDPFYGVWYQLSYTPISGVYSDQCVDLYQQRIEAQLVTLTNALETGCQITDRSIIIMQATDAVEVQIQDPVMCLLMHAYIYEP